MANKQKKWIGFVAVEFYSEDCDTYVESYFKAKDKLQDMNEQVYDSYHGDSNVLYLEQLGTNGVEPAK